MRPSFLAAGAAIVLLLGIACQRTPVSPAPTTSTASVVSLAIGGPSRVAPGATATYTATAFYSDGTSRDVTSQLIWTPNIPGPSVPLYFAGRGTAVATHRGEVDIRVQLGSTKSVYRVLVLEPDTFKLSGSVVETGGSYISGANVDVISGIGSGLHVAADFKGAYALYGVAGEIRVRASAPGHNPQEQVVVVSSDLAAETLTVTPAEQPATIDGTWVMSLATAPGCIPGPADLIRDRRYNVRFIQNGTVLALSIASPTLEVRNPGENYGTVYGSRVFFTFIGDTNYGDWSSADLIDHISASQTFEFDGRVDAVLAGAEIRGLLNGDFMYYEGSGRGSPTWSCRANDHPVTLRR